MKTVILGGGGGGGPCCYGVFVSTSPSVEHRGK